MLVPVAALLTRSMLTAEPDAARAVVAVASGPARHSSPRWRRRWAAARCWGWRARCATRRCCVIQG